VLEVWSPQYSGMGSYFPSHVLKYDSELFSKHILSKRVQINTKLDTVYMAHLFALCVYMCLKSTLTFSLLRKRYLAYKH